MSAYSFSIKGSLCELTLYPDDKTFVWEDELPPFEDSDLADILDSILIKKEITIVMPGFADCVVATLDVAQGLCEALGFTYSESIEDYVIPGTLRIGHLPYITNNHVAMTIYSEVP